MRASFLELNYKTVIMFVSKVHPDLRKIHANFAQQAFKNWYLDYALSYNSVFNTKVRVDIGCIINCVINIWGRHYSLTS